MGSNLKPVIMAGPEAVIRSVDSPLPKEAPSLPAAGGLTLVKKYLF
jgi:hypothetical protein